MKIGFVGLGHLGICHSVAAAMQGFDVMCYDPDAKNLIPAPLGRVVVPNEPGLKDALGTALGRMQFASHSEFLTDCSIVFVACDVNQPQDEQAVADVFGHLHARLPQHIAFVVVSQVAPGFTRRQLSGLRKVYYQLDPIICGQGFERCYKPERFVVGCNDPIAPLHTHYGFYLLAFGCPVYAMNYEEAEFSKLAINTMLAAQIATSNELEICAAHYDAQWERIAVALRSDPRIGQRAYLRPGKIGGHLPRDISRLNSAGLSSFLKDHLDG